MLNSHQGRRGPTRRSGSTEFIHSRCPAPGRETQHFIEGNLQLLLAAEGEEEDVQTPRTEVVFYNTHIYTPRVWTSNSL